MSTPEEPVPPKVPVDRDLADAAQAQVATEAVTQAPRRSPTDTSYPFPARAEDLHFGEYWSVNKEVHGGGAQHWGYDFRVERFDPDRPEWIPYTVERADYTADPRNESWIVYGKPVYALGDGEVVRAWRNAPDNPTPGTLHPGRLSDPVTIAGGGNALWVHQDDGNHALYAHMAPGTIPAALCPNDAEFFSDPAELDIPEGQRPRVRRGEFVGRVGNSGASSNPHLHLHLQDRGPGTTGAEPVVLAFNGARIKGKALRDDAADWRPVDPTSYLNGPVLVLPDYGPGQAEIAYHGVRAADYQFLHEHVAGSGYRLEWIDGFATQRDVHFNVVFRPAEGVRSWAFHGLTGERYQTEFDRLTKAGRRLTHVAIYSFGTRVFYAAAFTDAPGPPFTAYHGLTATQHQERFEELTGAGWRPKNVAVTSVGGQRRYAGLYEKRDVGSFVLRSFLTPAEYQQHFDANREAGRNLAYLCAYDHDGSPRFSAIWTAAAPSQLRARHGLSGRDYQQAWREARRAGLLTRAVTGYRQDGRVRYAAFWS